MHRLTPGRPNARTGFMLNDRSPRTVRTAAAVSIALAAAALVALIEWDGARRQAAGDGNAQPQSKAESSRGHLLAPVPLEAPARSARKPAEDEQRREAGLAS